MNIPTGRKLAGYLAEHGIKHQDFAAKSGLHQVQLSAVITGKLKMPRKASELVEKNTNYYILAEEWYQ